MKTIALRKRIGCAAALTLICLSIGSIYASDHGLGLFGLAISGIFVLGWALGLVLIFRQELDEKYWKRAMVAALIAGTFLFLGLDPDKLLPSQLENWSLIFRLTLFVGWLMCLFFLFPLEVGRRLARARDDFGDWFDNTSIGSWCAAGIGVVMIIIGILGLIITWAEPNAGDDKISFFVLIIFGAVFTFGFWTDAKEGP